MVGISLADLDPHVICRQWRRILQMFDSLFKVKLITKSFYSVMLMSITNLFRQYSHFVIATVQFFKCISLFLAPALVWFFVDIEESRTEWRTIFFILAVLLFSVSSWNQSPQILLNRYTVMLPFLVRRNLLARRRHPAGSLHEGGSKEVVCLGGTPQR